MKGNKDPVAWTSPEPILLAGGHAFGLVHSCLTDLALEEKPFWTLIRTDVGSPLNGPLAEMLRPERAETLFGVRLAMIVPPAAVAVAGQTSEPTPARASRVFRKARHYP